MRLQPSGEMSVGQTESVWRDKKLALSSHNLPQATSSRESLYMQHLPYLGSKDLTIEKALVPNSTCALFHLRAIFTCCCICQVHHVADDPVPQDLKAEVSHSSTLSSYTACSQRKLLMPKSWLNPLDGSTQMGIVQVQASE